MSSPSRPDRASETNARATSSGQRPGIGQVGKTEAVDVEHVGRVARSQRRLKGDVVLGLRLEGGDGPGLLRELSHQVTQRRVLGVR